MLYLPLPHTRLMLPLEVGFWEIDELGETQLGGPARTDKHARLPGVGFLPQHTVMSKGGHLAFSRFPSGTHVADMVAIQRFYGAFSEVDLA